MAKSNHAPDADGLTQNQNNAMSDDPGDGGRKSFTTTIEGEGPPGAKPDDQGAERLAELGRKGSKQD